MNILIALSSRCVDNAMVMITSLFINNKNFPINIYVLCFDINDEEKEFIQKLCNDFKQRVTFLEIDCPVFADAIFPDNLDRILFLDVDVIIEKEIISFYQLDFEDFHLIACGQTLNHVQGKYYKIGARPEQGGCFDCGVLLVNLNLLRGDIFFKSKIKTMLKADSEIQDYRSILNIVFEGKVKIICPEKYNFRINLLEDYLMARGDPQKVIEPAIIQYIPFDYYHIQYKTQPWNLAIGDIEYKMLSRIGAINHNYILKTAEEFSKFMNWRWWYYAKKTEIYKKLRKQMKEEKRKTIKMLFEVRTLPQIASKMQNEKKKREVFEQITKGNFERINNLSKFRYQELEKYIDEIDTDAAIRTMRNLFQYVCKMFRREERIRVAFLVYSSAEWQCESIYRLMEKDRNFDPWIVICAYNHGTKESIRKTYVSTCAYFRDSGKNYQIKYAGFCERRVAWKSIDDFNIIFYITPYNNILVPGRLNMYDRKINQLCIWVPYAIMLVDMSPLGPNNFFLNHTVVKLSWYCFCMEKSAIDMIQQYQMLGGYNTRLSGSPKMDELIEHTYIQRDNLWKTNDKTQYKIIWAPHFNMKKGMNGTFHENYKWFFQFASCHKEISWIVRPHPRMEWGVKEFHVFAEREEYLEYLRNWDALPNGKVILEGDYLDIFDSSDAMILDSISFRAEYQYTGKPMLILQSAFSRLMSATEEKLQKGVYLARGNDFEAIERFILEEIGKDPRKEIRLQLFKECLDYKRKTGKLASQFIYDCICSDIFREDGKMVCT